MCHWSWKIINECVCDKERERERERRGNGEGGGGGGWGVGSHTDRWLQKEKKLNKQFQTTYIVHFLHSNVSLSWQTEVFWLGINHNQHLETVCSTFITQIYLLLLLAFFYKLYKVRFPPQHWSMCLTIWFPLGFSHCISTASLAYCLRRPPQERKIWGSNPACDRIFPGWVIPETKKLAFQWIPCQAPGVILIGSALGLVGLVSVFCDWVR